MLILYGSQTGTAQDVATNLLLASLGTTLTCRIFALDEYDVKNLVEEEIALFICSTTGQGDTPDNMKKFWKFIMRKVLPRNSLQNLKYAVLGLGDSSYNKYNFIAKKLHRRLEQLGGSMILPLYLADDQHDLGIDITVDEWYTAVWNAVFKIKRDDVSIEMKSLQDSLPPTRYFVNEIHGEIMPHANGDNHNTIRFVNVPLISNDRVTADDHFQDTRLIKLNILQDIDKLTYTPGDVGMVLPSNLHENVEEFLNLLSHINPDKSFKLSCNFPNIPMSNRLKNRTSLRDLATNYFDIMSIPRRSFFQILQHIATDEMEKEKMQEFAAKEGSDDRIDYANRPRRSILEVLQDFHKTAGLLTIERLLDVIPEIQPRAFSIASSPSHHTGEIHLLVAIVKYKTKLKLPRRGLCSTWFTTLHTGSMVPIYIKTGGLTFPKTSHSNHVIMIGPGTGVSPFRSAIHEYNHTEKADMTLFFGCRNKDKDFYFQTEWDRLKSLNLYTAFSRDQEDKVYVQHVLKEHGEKMWELITGKNSVIFIAGNSKNMPDEVKKSFFNIIKIYGNMNDDETESYIQNLFKTKRYQQETWS